MKRIVSYLLVVIMLLALVPAALAATPTFSDITNPQTARDVAVLRMLGVVEGDNGRFFPDGTLTRAAFCKMAVIIKGKGAEEPASRSRTIFPDVRSDHWARGYINIAASDGIVAGNSDGTFRPDDNITYAQAITILLRMLGYTDADTGLLWPSDHIRFASNLGLTKGMTVESGKPIPRSAAARLFANLLVTEMKDGKEFLTTLGEAVTDAIIIDLDATASDGTKGAVRTNGGTYKSKSGVLPEAFLGQRGTLVLSGGQVLTFIPSEGRSVSFIAASANAVSIKDSAGKEYVIPAKTTVYTPEGTSTFEDIFIDIAAGTQITIFYKDDVIDALYLETRQSESAVVVLTDSVTPAAFNTLTGGDTGYVIYKNGLEVSYRDIRKYDVATYNRAAKVMTVSDFRITAYYENVWPNTTHPSEVTFLGTKFNVLPSAQESLSAFRPGEVITFVMTADKLVAGAFSSKDVRATPIGVASDVTATSATVTLLSGEVFSGNPQLTDEQAGKLNGELVTMYSSKAGGIYISKVGATGGYRWDADLGAMTFNTTKISSGVRIFDKVKNSAVAPVSRQDLLVGKIPASKILYINIDSGGQIDLIVTNDFTGDAYNYGFVAYKTATVDYGTAETIHRYAAVRNSLDTAGDTWVMTSHEYKNGAAGGVALAADGKSVAGYIALTHSDGVRRSDFKTVGERIYASADGTDIPVADNVQCYNKTTNVWSAGIEALNRARAYSDNLTVYYDRPAAENGKIRMVVYG